MTEFIDMLKRDPGGVALMTSGLATVPSGLILEAPNYLNKGILPALSVGLVALGIRHVRVQSRIRSRLQEHIQQEGFEERVFVNTIYSPCVSHTARLVCKEAGLLDQYEQMYAKRKPSIIGR